MPKIIRGHASHKSNGPLRAAQASALIVVVVLLLLATLFVVFALSVGRFEQKTSGNDLRAKIAQEIAEAGMHQGVEYFNAKRTTEIRDWDKWETCGAAESTFPCGAVAASRRGSMMYFKDGTGTGGKQVPIPNPITSSGGFPAEQQVGAVICWIKKSVDANAATECTTNADEASTTWLLTVVAKGELTGEASNATVSQTVGAFNIFSMGPAIPPLVASGSVSVGGGLQIVTAPNAGGIGTGSNIPVSVWTRLDMTKSGTPNTCYLVDYLSQGGTSDVPRYFEGIEVCDTCKCPGTASLSYPMSGGKACEGRDILDIDFNAANDCAVLPNQDVNRDEFPSDLFAFVFGQNAWDDNERDGIAVEDPCPTPETAGSTYPDCNFGETRRVSSCTFPFPGTGAATTLLLPEDTCYLLNIKTLTHIGDGINDAAECAALDATKPNSLKGIVWVHKQAFAGLPGYDCDGTITKAEIGSPSKPVALIYDGALTQVNGLKLFGLLFLREPNASAGLSPTTGGTADFSISGNAIIYGAAVVQGQIMSSGGGSGALVYNEKVLSALVADPENETTTALPGSWTDGLRY